MPKVSKLHESVEKEYEPRWSRDFDPRARLPVTAGLNNNIYLEIIIFNNNPLKNGNLVIQKFENRNYPDWGLTPIRGGIYFRISFEGS